MNRAQHDNNPLSNDSAPRPAQTGEGSARVLDELSPPSRGYGMLRLPPLSGGDSVDRADVSAHGPPLSSTEISALRRGYGATVHGELLSEHVVRALNEQLRHHSLDEIAQSLNRLPEPREILGQVYELVTQYGAIEQLRRLAEVISERCYGATGPSLYAPGDTSLGAVVRYLGINKSILPVDWKVRSSPKIEPESIVVFDDTVLTRMRSDPTFVRAIIDGKATLLCPLGYFKGVTPFRTPDLGEVENRVASIIGQAELHPQDSPDEVERKVVAAMRFEVLSHLHRIDPRLSDRVEFVAARLAPGETPVERIASQLNGQAGISAESFEAVIGRLDPRYRPVVKNLLVEHALIHSHISLGLAVREHGALIVRQAAEGKVDLEDVAIHCPEPNKSFTMYGMIFREGNPEFPVSSYTTPANLVRWLEARGDRPRLVVILDDFAGSGESLARAASATRAVAPTLTNEEIVLSPLIATEPSLQQLRNGEATMGSCIAAVSVKPRIIDEVGYRVASPEVQLTQRAALGALGFSEVGMKVALPYMSPDNNAELFAQCFAEYFVLAAGAVRNHHGGVKVYAAKLQGPPLDVMRAQVTEKLSHTRHVAGLLPTLKGLLESERCAVQYWENLPVIVQEMCEPDWVKTRAALREERSVAVYTQLNLIRDVLEAPEASARDRLRFVLDYKELEVAALKTDLAPEVRQAIAEFRDNPALKRELSSS